jgi:hypothetical protein
MIEGGLLTPSDSRFCCCWMRSSESASPPTVKSVSTSTDLMGAKKFYVGTTVGCAATAPSDLVDHPFFLTEPGLASSEEFVLFRLRCSRNSHSSGAIGAADKAIVPPTDRNRSKFTMPTSEQQVELYLNCTAHRTRLQQASDISVKSSSQLLSALSHQSHSCVR